MERSTSVFVTALVANGLSKHYKTEERLGVRDFQVNKYPIARGSGGAGGDGEEEFHDVLRFHSWNNLISGSPLRVVMRKAPVFLTGGYKRTG